MPSEILRARDLLASLIKFGRRLLMGVYVYRNEQVEGPFDALVLQQALMNGTMGGDELCCREGSEDWIPASSYFKRIPALPPAAPPPTNNTVLSQLPGLAKVWDFWRRLGLGQKVTVIVLGSFAALFIFALAIAGSQSPESPTQSHSPQTQLQDIDTQLAQVKERQDALGIQLIGIMAEIAQAKQNGMDLTPEGANHLTQQFLYMTKESEDLKQREQYLVEQRKRVVSLQ